MTHLRIARRLALTTAVLSISGLAAAAPQDEKPPPPAESAQGPTSEPKPWLVDVSDAVGLDFVHRHGGTGERYLPETMGSGGCVLDADGDGLLDLYLVQSGPLRRAEDPPGEATPANQLYLQRRGATDAPRFEASPAAADRGYGQGALCADFDGDGATDIYVTNVGRNSLWLGDGAGGFREVGAAAGVDDPAWGTSAAAFDAEGDGDLDLYVVNYLDFTLATHRDCRHGASGTSIYCHPDAYPPAADVFYRNLGPDPDGLPRFEATTMAELVDGPGKGLGAVAADFNGDGRADLYVTNDSTPNFLFHNLGQGRFEEVGLFEGVAYNEEGKTEAGMGVDAGDVDGDGRLDLVVTNLSLETNALYLAGPEGFVDARRQAGLHAPSYAVLGFGTDLLDLDNDGALDLLVTNGDVLDNIELINDALRHAQPGQIFRGDGGGHFTELAAERVGDFAAPRVGRGLAILDFDDDGRLDVLVSYNDDRARLFRNQAPATGHWIGFDLRGPIGNTHAIGTRVTIEAGDRRWVDEVKAGSSYLTSSDPRLHFGLGTVETIDRVTLRWPDGQVDTWTDLAIDRYHRLSPR